MTTAYQRLVEELDEEQRLRHQLQEDYDHLVDNTIPELNAEVRRLNDSAEYHKKQARYAREELSKYISEYKELERDHYPIWKNKFENAVVVNENLRADLKDAEKRRLEMIEKMVEAGNATVNKYQLAYSLLGTNALKVLNYFNAHGMTKLNVNWTKDAFESYTAEERAEELWKVINAKSNIIASIDGDLPQVNYNDPFD